MRFETPEALRAEFEKNISNQGVFVATDEPLEVRQAVTVEIVLTYVSSTAPSLTLEGEIVHRIPPEMASSGVAPGVAVQFEESAAALRERFAPLLGQEAEAIRDPEADTEGPRRRGAKRGAVRVPVRVMPTNRPPFEATSRDLSATGILLSMRGEALPVGEIVRVCLWHPSGDPSVEIDGKVVRQIPNRKGRIAAVAVAFERNQAADPRTREVIDDLRQAGHRSRLGGISGAISDLGLANMLQMFGSSAPEGTVVVEHDGEQGWIAFSDGQLLGAELGALRGRDALIAMLGWVDGRFHFEATADPAVVGQAEPRPLAGAVLDAVCALDEQEREDVDGGETQYLPQVRLEDDMTFEIDFEQEEQSRTSLDKLDLAVLDLAKSGMCVGRLRDVIPEPGERVQTSLEGLVEMGVLVPR